jgi:6-hydroxynicotinate reductase
VRAEVPAALEPTVALIDENCEPSLCTVLFMGGAGGSLRAGVTANPVRLTRSVQGGSRGSPAGARRSMSGRGAGSPSWST